MHELFNKEIYKSIKVKLKRKKKKKQLKIVNNIDNVSIK